jgi:hypothetical protein
MKPKKILSCLLAAALALSGLSISAFAETSDGNYYADPTTALTVEKYLYTTTYPEPTTKTRTCNLRVYTKQMYGDSDVALFQVECTGWDYVAEKLNEMADTSWGPNYDPFNKTVDWTGEYLKEQYDNGNIQFNMEIPSVTTDLDNYEWCALKLQEMGYTWNTKQSLIDSGYSYEKLWHSVGNHSAWVTSPIIIGTFTMTKIVQSDPVTTKTGAKLSDGTEVTFTDSECADGTHDYKYRTDNYLAATCLYSGFITYVCSKCGNEELKNLDQLSHNYVTEKKDPTCTEDGYTQERCTFFDEVQNKTVIKATGHSYDDGKVTKAATCAEEGVKTYTCKTCGATKTETIATKSHTVVTDSGVAAACTVDGKTEGSHCSVCGKVITPQTVVKAKGHSYDDGKVTKAATCTAEGVKTYTCKTCNAVTTKAIKATGHSYKTTVVKPTTSAQGYTLHKCTVCNSSYKDSYTAKLVALSKCKATIAKSSYVYTGKAIKPTVTVKYGSTKLKSGTDYTVSYKNNTKTGKATITVKGKGKYTGTLTKTFNIIPKQATVSSVTSPKKSQLKVTWKKDSQATGYQLVYSTSSSFKSAKTVNITKNSTVSKTISKLTAGKKYYVKVRSYKTVDGKKVYGAYSKVKSVTVKKK